MKVELSDELFLRFAAAKAMARPAFSSLKSRLTLDAAIPDDVRDDFFDPETGEPIAIPTPDDYKRTSDSEENPYLDPMESTQFDLSLEWYYAKASSAYVALFTKDITGYQVTEFTTEYYGAEGFDIYDYEIERPVSTGTAKLQGVELSLNHFFTSLPAPFDGLGIQANYTYIDSSTDVEADGEPIDTDGSSYDREMPYKGISEHAYNLIGIYQKNGFTARIAYNWRSEFLTSVGANGFNGSIPLSADGYVRPNGQGVLPDGSTGDTNWRLPVMNADAGYLDASLSYDINENFRVSFSANNLTNTVTKNINLQNGAGDHYSAYHSSDTRYSLALSAHF